MAVPAADTMRQSGVTGLALGPGPVDTTRQRECSGTKKTVAAASTTHAISQSCAVVRNRAARSLVTPGRYNGGGGRPGYRSGRPGQFLSPKLRAAARTGSDPFRTSGSVGATLTAG